MKEGDFAMLEPGNALEFEPITDGNLAEYAGDAEHSDRTFARMRLSKEL